MISVKVEINLTLEKSNKTYKLGRRDYSITLFYKLETNSF